MFLHTLSQNHYKASAHKQDVSFIHFDYHSEIKGSNLKNLERLKAKVIKQIQEFDFFYAASITNAGEAQRSVLRGNVELVS